MTQTKQVGNQNLPLRWLASWQVGNSMEKNRYSTSIAESYRFVCLSLLGSLWRRVSMFYTLNDLNNAVHHFNWPRPRRNASAQKKVQTFFFMFGRNPSFQTSRPPPPPSLSKVSSSLWGKKDDTTLYLHNDIERSPSLRHKTNQQESVNSQLMGVKKKMSLASWSRARCYQL